MEVGIPRDDAADAMLAHEDRRVRIVKQVGCEMGKLREGESASAAYTSTFVSTTSTTVLPWPRTGPLMAIRTYG